MFRCIFALACFILLPCPVNAGLLFGTTNRVVVHNYGVAPGVAYDSGMGYTYYSYSAPVVRYTYVEPAAPPPPVVTYSAPAVTYSVPVVEYSAAPVGIVSHRQTVRTRIKHGRTHIRTHTRTHEVQ